MVPEDWELVSLGEMFDFKNGLNADKERYGHGVKFVNVMDIFRSDRLFEDAIAGRVSINEKERNAYGLKFGDVLFNRTSETFDEIAMSAVYLDQSPAVFGGFVIRGRPKTNKIDPQYSVYLFQESNFRKAVISKGQGAVRANIGQRELSGIRQLIPPVLEQQKIAKILSTWDEAIAATEQLLANSEQQKKALMQQLLTGKKRLPGFEGEWSTLKLSEAALVAMGSSPKSAAYNEDGVGLPLLQGNADIKNRKSSPRIHSSEITKECEIGDILLSVRAPVGTVALAQHHACIGRGICSIRAKENVSQGYLYQWMLLYEPKWASRAQGSTFESINGADVKNLEINIPELSEQEAIAKVFSAADKDADYLAKEVRSLRKEKKALMQQLLTGKRRVVINDNKEVS